MSSVGRWRSAAAAAALAAAALAASAAAAGAIAPTSDPNDYSCFGHIARGRPEAGVAGVQVAYRFACSGPITGYQIETEPHRISYFDQSPAVAGVPAAADGFSCSAFIPGVQLNCTGRTSAPQEVISGQFAISARGLCSEPRPDPILTVTDASADGASLTQYIAGPFDLGRPWGCRGDRYGAHTRLGRHPPRILLRAGA